MSAKTLKISLAHFAPVLADIEQNRRLIERAIAIAVEQKSDWLVTPELAVCGYEFERHIGTNWILPQPDEWLTRICYAAAKTGMTLFVSIPERDADKLYNSVFVVNGAGLIAGKHRKVRALGGSEAWSSAGDTAAPVEVDGLKVGILICADAYSSETADALKTAGAEIFISAANWGPGLHGPKDEWERRTLETNLPLVVCNRTGAETGVDFRRAESLFVKNGRKTLAFNSEQSTLLTFELDLATMNPVAGEFQQITLNFND